MGSLVCQVRSDGFMATIVTVTCNASGQLTMHQVPIELFTASATLPGSRKFAGHQSTVGQPEFSSLSRYLPKVLR